MLDAAAGMALADPSVVSYPCWVKPARLGSSVGIAPVDAPGGLEAAIEAAAAHDPRVIVEASARGIEVECSVLGPPTRRRPASPARSSWPAARTAGTTTRPSTPRRHGARGAGADLRAARERVRELAVSAFRLAGCSGLARADFFVDGEDVLLTSSTRCPASRRRASTASSGTAAALGYPELCDRLVRIAVERFEREHLHLF